MSEPVSYKLPFPPSVNHYWRRKGSIVFISGPGKAFLRDVIAICSGCEKMMGRLSVSILLVLPDRRERDIDNYLKSTFDSLAKAGAFGNDNQIDELTVKRGPVRPPGACEITITEIVSDMPSQLSLVEQFQQAEAEKF